MKHYRRIIEAVTGVGITTLVTASFAFYKIAIMRSKSKTKDSKEAAEVPMKIGKLFEPYREQLENAVAWFSSQPYETVTITSYDGLKLTGYYLECEEPKRTIVCVHGYKGTALKDFPYIARFYHENHCNVLLIDQRGHGNSEGNYVDLGIQARYDVVGWLQYLELRLGGEMPLYMDGVSMGAATVLMASGQKLPKQVCGILADCGYTSPWEMVKEASWKLFHVPWFPLIYFMDIQCRIRAGYSLKECSAKEELKKCKVPVLFVHGNADDFVPPYMSQENYEACGCKDKQIEFVEKAGHGLSYMVEENRCKKTILEFFERTEASHKKNK